MAVTEGSPSFHLFCVCWHFCTQLGVLFQTEKPGVPQKEETKKEDVKKEEVCLSFYAIKMGGIICQNWAFLGGIGQCLMACLVLAECFFCDFCPPETPLKYSNRISAQLLTLSLEF